MPMIAAVMTGTALASAVICAQAFRKRLELERENKRIQERLDAIAASLLAG